MTEFLQRLKERKLGQWALAYGAAAFALMQASTSSCNASIGRSLVAVIERQKTKDRYAAQVCGKSG